jgi:hypothetical protein
MAKDHSSAKIVGWLGGVAATVISGYLLWYFEQPKPIPPPPLVPAVTTFEGMVYSGDAPVAKALVAVALTGSAGANGAIHDVTDDNGAYRIELTGLPAGTGATLSVAANGFEETTPKVLAEPLQTDVRVDIPLNPVLTAVGAPPGLGAGHGGGNGAANRHAPPPAEAPIAHRPVYVPKSAAMAMKFRIAAKQ